MRNEGAANRERASHERVPTRVVLRGEPDGWHYVIVDRSGAEQRSAVARTGIGWQTGGRSDPEPPWWRRSLADTAERLRELVAERLTDRAFADLGVEAEITWFVVDEPIEWEGIVTLREADPARFPGRVPPFVVTLQPGRGAVLPDANLFFSTHASDAWTTLAAVAERCGTPAPKASFLCGWADHRSVRIGRGSLALSTDRGEDGVERLAEIYGTRRPGWSGNPEMRFHLDGIDLLDEPAEDVMCLFEDLGHEVVRRGRGARIPAMGLSLYEPEKTAESVERFTGVSLQLPNALTSLWRRA